MGTGWPTLGTEVSVSSGTAMAGSTSLTVTSAAGFTLNQYALISMINDGVVATSYGGEGVCTFCDTRWYGARSTQQIVQVTGIVGNVLTVSPALYTDFSPTQTAPAFTTNSATISNISETSGSVVTLTVTTSLGTFVAGQYAYLTGLTTGTWLNGRVVNLTSATGATLVFNDPTSHGIQASHSETGTVTNAVLEGQIVEASSTLYVCTVSSCTSTPPGGSWQSLINGASASPFLANESNAGVENLQVYANDTGYTSGFYMGGCVGCWIKGVESN
jgi:hypothetical protein